MSTSTYLKTILLIATCLFFLSCSSPTSQNLVRLEYGDSILFKTGDGLAVPLDISSAKLKTKFDIALQNSTASAELQATIKESGQPYFLCNCDVQMVMVEGSVVPFERLKDPDQQNSECA